MSSFTFETTPKIICAPGCSAELGGIAARPGIRHALVVTDAGMLAPGLSQPIEAGFAATGVAVTIFSHVQTDPPEAEIGRAVRALYAEAL